MDGESWKRACLATLMVAVAADAAPQPPSQAPPECATPEQLAQLSGTIVYEGDPIEGADPARNFELWITGAPDWTPHLVAGGPEFDGHPAWSPDGRAIVYSAHGGRNPDLFIIEPDGSGRRRMTTSEVRDDYPVWLPEGIVYKSGRKRCILNPATGEIAEHVTFGPNVDRFAISPDGTRVVVAMRDRGVSDSVHLHLAKPDGTLLRQLTHTYPREIHPAWAPDGRRIAYSAGDGRRDGDWEVRVLDLESGENRAITDNPGADWACAWSPDGDWVLIASEYGGNWDLYAIRPDGSGRMRITCHAGNARYGVWTRSEPLRH